MLRTKNQYDDYSCYLYSITAQTLYTVHLYDGFLLFYCSVIVLPLSALLLYDGFLLFYCPIIVSPLFALLLYDGFLLCNNSITNQSNNKRCGQQKAANNRILYNKNDQPDAAAMSVYVPRSFYLWFQNQSIYCFSNNYCCGYPFHAVSPKLTTGLKLTAAFLRSADRISSALPWPLWRAWSASGSSA